MPIQVEVREAGQILYVAFGDSWDTGELKQAVAAIQSCLSSASHPMYLVVDARSIFQVPLGTLSQIPAQRPSLATTNVTECIFIGGTSLTRSIAQAAFKISNLHRFTFVESEEQAWNRLRTLTRRQLLV